MESFEGVLRRIPNSDLATESEVQFLTNIPESILSKKILVQKYGIFCFRINKATRLTENLLKELHNCDSVFLPTNNGFHRYVYFLFFQSNKQRNQALEQFKKNTALAFEVSSKPAEVALISQFLGQIKNIDPINEKTVLKSSHTFLTRIVKEIIVAFEDFEKSLNPCRQNLLYFLIFEFYLFFKKYFKEIKSVEFYPLFLALTENRFVEKFFSIERHNVDIVFEIFFYFMHTDNDRCPPAISVLNSYQLANIQIIKLSKAIPKKLLIAILNKKRVKSLFIRYTKQNFYNKLIKQVIENSFIDEFYTGFRGLTLFNLSLCISSFSDVREDNLVIQGARIVTFLYEFGNYIVRANKATAMSVIEHTSGEYTCAKADSKAKIEESKAPVTEGGDQIEIALFGQKMEAMTPLAARWLTNPKNWDTENFKEEFMKQYNAPLDIGGKPNIKFRMKASFNHGLIHMGCATFSVSWHKNSFT